MDECYINFACGRVKGYQEGEIQFFRGIPYATARRFEKPEIIDHWDGTYDATQSERECFQYTSFRDESKDEFDFYYKEFRSERSFIYSEDCQVLNIVTPRMAKGLPILIFIHGGGHETGTVGELPYGLCSEYAKRGVMYVSVGYRVNILSLYECGNYGLFDLITAIEWIQKNGEAFGGDTSRVTLMGQSAGAMSITDLCLSQRLKGMIQGAVLMSGAGFIPGFACPMTKEKAAPFWAEIRELAGAKDTEAMKELPIQTIWEVWFQCVRKRNDFHSMQPGVDGEIIADMPQKIKRAGTYLDIPIIAGVTSQDFLCVLMYELALDWGMANTKQKKAPIYGYLFDRALPGNSFKAFHGADLWYMFGNMDQSWRPFEKIDYDLAAQMMDYVAAFVKSGNPNTNDLPEWKPITRNQKGFRLLDGVSDGMINPSGCRRKVWHTLIKDRGPM